MLNDSFDKICLVTGATGGLGRAIARGLAERGATVILACRNPERGEQVRFKIVSATGNPKVRVELVDLASQRSIREFVQRIRSTYSRVDVLIHNAAIFSAKRIVTPDGLELMFATNHLAPFLMSQLLDENLVRGSRVEVVTAPSTVALNFDDLQSEKKFSALTAFGASKMANLLFTYELARRLESKGVTANAIHPGLVKSELMKESPAPMYWLTRLLSAAPEKGAETPIFLATSPGMALETGKFFKGKRPIESNSYSHDTNVQRRLWELSIALCEREQR